MLPGLVHFERLASLDQGRPLPRCLAAILLRWGRGRLGRHSATSSHRLRSAPSVSAVAVEIERKFRLEREPDWLRDCEATRIEQGYLAIEGSGGTEIRLRRRDGETLLTVKRGSGEIRTEEEIALEREQFEALWPLTDGRVVEKVRYLVPTETGEIEVDVFEGELAGMITAEMEFESEAQRDAFDPPEWLGREVTGDERYANETLAVHGLPEETER
jgi:adenylate cyclase